VPSGTDPFGRDGALPKVDHLGLEPGGWPPAIGEIQAPILAGAGKANRLAETLNALRYPLPRAEQLRLMRQWRDEFDLPPAARQQLDQSIEQLAAELFHHPDQSL
jgi:hypothetical protein